MTGAAIVFSRLPSDSAGLSRALPSGDFTKRMRAGLQLALVGPILASSQSARSSVSLTGFLRHLLCVRAPRNSASSAASSRILPKPGLPPAAPPPILPQAARQSRAAARASDRANLLHFRDVVAQHILDAGLERRGR